MTTSVFDESFDEQVSEIFSAILAQSHGKEMSDYAAGIFCELVRPQQEEEGAAAAATTAVAATPPPPKKSIPTKGKSSSKSKSSSAAAVVVVKKKKKPANPFNSEAWRASVAESVEEIVEEGGEELSSLVSRMESLRLRMERRSKGEPEEDEEERREDEESDVVSEDGEVVHEKDWCLALLMEDGEWHEGVVEQILLVPLTQEEIDKKKKTSKKSSSSSSIIPKKRKRLFVVRFSEYNNKQTVDRSQLRIEAEIAFEDDVAGRCLMCAREMPLTRHHLVPRMVHEMYRKMGYSDERLNTTVDICRSCHSQVHRIADEETLAREYDTLEKLLANEKVQKFIAYARNLKKQTLWDHKMLMRK